MKQTSSLVSDIGILPTLSTVATQLITQLSDEFVELKAVSTLVEQDAACSLQLLRLANSALYNVATPIETIEDAIIKVLGLDVTRAVCLGIAFSDSFDVKKCTGINLEKLWIDSLMMARCTALGVKEHPELSGYTSIAYTGALLSNVGIMALAVIEPEALDDCIVGAEPWEFDERIVQQFNLSHREITVQLFDRWHLPTILNPLVRLESDSNHSPEMGLAKAAARSRELVDAFNKAQDPATSAEEDFSDAQLALVSGRPNWPLDKIHKSSVATAQSIGAAGR